MELSDLTASLKDSIEEYDRGLAGIRHCLARFEMECVDKINLIGKSARMADAEPCFDALSEIAGSLSLVLWARGIPIGERQVKSFTGI